MNTAHATENEEPIDDRFAPAEMGLRSLHSKWSPLDQRETGEKINPFTLMHAPNERALRTIEL